MPIREDYIHYVPVTFESRVWNSDATKLDHCVYKGTSEQIAAQVTKAVQHTLDNGATTQIVLTPMAPHAVIDLGRES